MQSDRLHDPACRHLAPDVLTMNMRGTYLEWRGRYSNGLFVGAELSDGVLRVRVRGGQALHRFFGIPVAIDLALADISSVELFRHPVSKIARARVRVVGGTGEETYVFSTWVGEELIAAGAPRRG